MPTNKNLRSFMSSKLTISFIIFHIDLVCSGSSESLMSICFLEWKKKDLEMAISMFHLKFQGIKTLKSMKKASKNSLFTYHVEIEQSIFHYYLYFHSHYKVNLYSYYVFFASKESNIMKNNHLKKILLWCRE